MSRFMKFFGFGRPIAAAPTGTLTFQVQDATGHSTHIFDRSNPVDVKNAETMFDHRTRELKDLAFTKTGDGPARKITSLTEAGEKVTFARQLVGG